MKKRDVIAAVRERYPQSTAHAFAAGSWWEILPEGHMLTGYRPIGSAATEYSACCDARRHVKALEWYEREIAAQEAAP